MKKIAVVVISLLLLPLIPSIAGQRQPAGIGGYVFYNGKPAAGATVTVTNLNTSESSNATTNGDGLYATSLYAETGDILKAVASFKGESGSKTIVANLSNVTQWMNISITTGGGKNITADFTYYPKNPKVGETVQFIDESSGNINSWIWQFGDGYSSNEQNPTHIYNEGFYHVTLTVSGIGGTDSITKPIYVTNVSSPSHGTIIIPPLQPPLYPTRPYTIPQMYEIMGLKSQSPLYSHIKVAVIDTGVTSRVYYGNNFSIDLNNVAMYSIPKYLPQDENGHGTFTNAEVQYAINKWQLGKQYSIRVMSRDGTCSAEDLMNAMHIAENLGCNVVSLSLGGTGKLGDELDMMVREASKHGIIVVASAGNYGPDLFTITTPALSPSAIAVGAEDPMHTLALTADDAVPDWSSRGPVMGLHELKPDVVAGGESIIGPYLNDEKVLSGTSLSCPLIAGSVAYMMGSNEKLIHILDLLMFWHKQINQKLVEKALEQSSHKIVGNKYAQGHGLPDIPVATKLLHKFLWLYIIIMILIYITIIAIIGVIIKRVSHRFK